MKKHIPIIDLSPQEIANILKKAKTKIQAGESEDFKDGVMVHVRNYFVSRHTNRRPTISDTKKRLTQIVKDSERIAENLKTLPDCSGSEVIAYLKWAAFMKKLDLNFDDLDEVMWGINLSAEQALKRIEFRKAAEKARPGTKADKALIELINELSWLWDDTCRQPITISVDGAFTSFLHELFKALHSQLTEQHKKADPRLSHDLLISREAIKDRLKQLTIIKIDKNGAL